MALRGRRDSVQTVEQASSSRRTSVSALLPTAPGFTDPAIEHIVMFKVKADADLVKTLAMLDALHALRRLEGVLELTVGFREARILMFCLGVIKTKKVYKLTLSILTMSKSKRNIYMQGLVDDTIVLHWEYIPYGPVIEKIGAKRITLVKTEDETSADDMRFLVESIPRLPSK